MTLPDVGSVWEGCTKPGYPILRRKVVEITETGGVRWEPVGWGHKQNTKSVVTLSTWNTWKKRRVN
jgi:hypothetical protein